MRAGWFILGIMGVVCIAAVLQIYKYYRPGTADLDDVRKRVQPKLVEALAEKGLELGSRIYIRIFKHTSELELWIEGENGFELAKIYPICTYSGALGPKLKEGDDQSPEGFYQVSARQMNPNSNFHLSFNLGFPNAYDRAYGRTGSFLMVHGGCVSVGCYAMTNRGIEEIYLAAQAAHEGGQQAFDVHAFPFRMSDANLAHHQGSEWFEFWQDLKPAYDIFEATRQVPQVKVKGKSYQIAAF